MFTFFTVFSPLLCQLSSKDSLQTDIQCIYSVTLIISRTKRAFEVKWKFFFFFQKCSLLDIQKQTNSTQYIQCNCFRHVNCLSFLFFDLNYIEWYNSGEKLIKQQFRPFKDATHLHFSRHICLGLSLIANWCFPSDSFPFCERLDQKKTD